MISFSQDPDFFIVRVTSTKEFKEIELLLLSQGIPFTVRNDYWQKQFYIPLQYEEKAHMELRAFFKENKNWPPQNLTRHTTGFQFSILHILIILCLAFFHWHTTRADVGPNWFELGQFTAKKVLAGDWWRLCTSLTLHADDAHLLSNMAGLAVFVGGVGYFAGPGLSWLLVIVSGCLGNYLNALFSQTSHPGIGASTAVFSAVGLIGIFGIRNYYYQRQMKTRYLVPLLAGFGIFAMLGTNPQTDVSAHLFGFISGAVLGLMLLPLIDPQQLDSKFIQLFGLLLFCVLVYVSWSYPVRFG